MDEVCESISYSSSEREPLIAKGQCNLMDLIKY